MDNFIQYKLYYNQYKQLSLLNLKQQQNIFDMKQKFQIVPQKYGFPSKIGNFSIKTVTWKDFSGKAPQNTWFLAYTYWNTNYNCIKKGNKNIVCANVSIGTKSWVRAEYDFQLLQHQCGHYWIACLCALQFQKRINYSSNQPANINFPDWCKLVLNQTMKQFSSMQKLYDKQTYHYLNRKEQKDWEQKLSKMFNQYNKYFQQKQKQDKQNQFKIQREKQSQKRLASLQINKDIKIAQNNRKNIQPGSVPKQQKFIVKKFGTINPTERQISKSRKVKKRGVLGGFQIARQTLMGKIQQLNSLKNLD